MKKEKESQEYKVLARKYRPQKFEDLIGQEILVQSISNAILTNRIAHAYLLSGVRGVGKTTTARLIAMSLNCENKTKDTCEPCGECEICDSIKVDSNLDVIEMDAASRTGVDDIREIIDNVKYKPVNCKYKVFIIDEVHMLSKNAFNALLKTLEEPPPHIKFLFATTEVKKIPITIISRCQRFDLYRIEDEKISAHLDFIANKEKIQIDKDAITLIVRAADGSIRDSLSLLDQAIVNMKEIITSNTVSKMLGLSDRSKIFELMDNILKADPKKSLEIFNELYQNGADILMIFDDLLKITHFLTKLKINQNLLNDINIPEIERKKGKEISDKVSISSLGLVWQVLFRGYQDLLNSPNLFQQGEMIIIKLIFLYDGPTPDDLIKNIEEKIINTDVPNEIKSKEVDQNENATVSIEENTDYSKEIEKNDQNDKPINVLSNLVIRDFRAFVDVFFQKREGILHSYLYNKAKVVEFKEGEVLLNLDDISDKNFQRTIAKLISKWTGRIWQISRSNSNIGKTLYEEDLMNQQKEIEIFKKDEDIKKILDQYPGSKIHSISDIHESKDESTFVNNKLSKEK